MYILKKERTPYRIFYNKYLQRSIRRFNEFVELDGEVIGKHWKMQEVKGGNGSSDVVDK